MAEIRRFPSGKQTGEAEAASKTQDEKSHEVLEGKGHIARVIAACVVAGALLFIAYFSWRDKSYTEVSVSDSVPLAQAESIGAISLNGVIVEYSKDGVYGVDKDGEKLWNQTYEIQNPEVQTCGDVAAIGGKNESTIYVVQAKNGPLGKINTNLPVRNFCVARQGVVCAVLDDEDVTWVNLYSAEGKSLASIRTSMGNSGYPLAVSISPSGELVCVSYLREDAGTVKTSIAFYNFGSVGKNKVDNYASGYDYKDEVIPTVHFLNDQTAFAVSTDRIMYYNGDEIPKLGAQNLFSGEQIETVYHDDAHVGILFVNGTKDGLYRLEVYGTAGNLLFKKFLKKKYDKILFVAGRTVLYDSDEWLILGAGGEVRYQGNFSSPVKTVVPTSIRSRFLLVTADRIETVELR
ncbi:MAG: hypothetical protein HXK83_07805 [Lachnospiraceae bacterium]|nr:hypothetical protein [Lachnospiraceae bacterium]